MTSVEFGARARKLTILGIVFTLQPELWSKVTESTMVWFRRLGIETLKEFFGKDIEIGGMATEHSWHSDNPVQGGFYPHLHFRLSDVCIWKKDGSLRRLRGYFFKERLDELKRLWRKNVEKAFNVKIGMPVIHHGFTEGYGDIRRQIGYDLRSPIKDVSKYLSAGGNYDERGVRRFRRMIMDRKKNAKHVVYFGFMNEHRIGKFLKDLDIKYELMKEWRKKRREEARRCPMHPDSEMVELAGRFSFDQLEDECLFIGFSSDPVEMLGVEVG